MALDILIVDDETDIRELVAGVLEDDGYEARGAADSDAALAAIADRRPSLVLLDVWLKGSRLDGLDLLDEIKRRDPSLPVLMISGHGNLDTAVAAVRRGATDFIEKPFEAERLLHLVSRATETQRLRRENEALRAHIGYEADEAYTLLMYKCNPLFITDKATGEVIRMAGSFGKLNTKEAAEVQEAMIRFAAETGFYWDEI